MKHAQKGKCQDNLFCLRDKELSFTKFCQLVTHRMTFTALSLYTLEFSLSRRWLDLDPNKIWKFLIQRSTF
jgi:hypothetical protein